MSRKTLCRSLTRLSLVVVALALPAAAEEPGTQVTLTLARSQGEMPDPEKLVQALEAIGPDHQVRARKSRTPDQEVLTLELWGAFVPSAEIASTLRQAYPVLKAADIQTASLDPSLKPQPSKDDADATTTTTSNGVKRIVKKKVIRQP